MKLTGPAQRFIFGLASDGVYICRTCYQGRGGLLSRLFTLTRTAVAAAGGCFLLHWSWSRLRRTLSGILPCEARTFLPRIAAPAITHPTQTDLNFKITAAYEFPADRVVGNMAWIKSYEIFKELKEPLGLMIFRIFLGDLE